METPPQELEIGVRPPYRLDLTVAVLRRFSTNVVDVTAPGGIYVRAFSDPATPSLFAVRQRDATTLAVRFVGPGVDVRRDVALVRRILGTQAHAPDFERAARGITWLHGIVRATRGVRAPRYATLWEACVNAIVFQAVSLFAATAVLRRMIVTIVRPVRYEGVDVYPFPRPEEFVRTSDTDLRAAGLSFAKIAALRAVAQALLAGDLDEAMLERRSTPEAAALLCTIRGIGPWTAAVILLRGLGRLDQFPMKDSGVAKLITSLGGPDTDLHAVLDALGDERGMLYYYLLLGRLIAAGEVDPEAKPYP
jgi:DNA-3-methyladenine glycosylase II